MTLQMIRAILALNIPAIVSAAVGVLTLLAGIMGLFGAKRGKCKVFGVIIFVHKYKLNKIIDESYKTNYIPQ